MVIEMLIAVNTMLEKPSKVKVECARTILGKVIEHLEISAHASSETAKRYTANNINDPADVDLSPEAIAAKEELVSS